MTAATIEDSLNQLKANRIGHIRGKNSVIDEIQKQHLIAVDNLLTDIRIYIAKMSWADPATLKEIDNFLYHKQVG